MAINGSGEGLMAYDVLADRDAVAARFRQSPELDALTGQLNVYDMNSILTFGADAAEDVARASDAILRDMSASGQDDAGELLSALAGVMSRFDPEAFEGKKPGLLGRLFGGGRAREDGALRQYDAIGDELDKVLARLRGCQAALERSNKQLTKLFEANVEHLHALEKYIVAGEQGCREIEAFLSQKEAELARTHDLSVDAEVQTLRRALELLERRVQDLRTSEVVALQAIPMLRLTLYNNLSLSQKIDSAFIVTLPAFRQALTQALLLKRQRLQAEALKALETRVGRLPGSAETAPAPGDALSTAWRAATADVAAAQQLQAAAEAQREADRARLEEIKREYRK